MLTGTVRDRNCDQIRLLATALVVFATPYLSGRPASAQDAFQDFLKKDRNAFEQFKASHTPQQGPSRASREAGSAIISVQVEPSDKPQTLLSVQDRITVTVPAGALSEPTTLTVHKAREDGAVTIRDLGYRTLVAIEMALSPEVKLAKPLTIDVRYDPADLNPNVTPADQIRGARWDPDGGVWGWLPTAGVDAARGRAAVMCSQTGLVRWVSTAFDVRPAKEVAPQRLGGYLFLGGLIFSLGPGHAGYEYVCLDSLQNTASNFVVLCDAAAIRKAKIVGDAVWRKTNSVYSAALPVFVTDLLRYADESLETYRSAGFPCPSLPVVIKLDSWLLTLRPESYREPGAYEYTWGRIHLDTQYANPLNQSNLRHRIAHEVFHAMQREVIGKKWGSYSSALAYHWWHEGETVSISNPYLWWVEASAEYASCRVPWRLDEIGGFDDLHPRMLEYPLPFTGAPPGQTRFGALEYDKGMFILYLSQQHGFNLKDMVVSAKAALASSGSLLGALDTYLTTATGQGMLDHYRRFAHWFVLSGDVGPQAMEPWESATRSDTLPPYTAGQSAGVSHPVSWACKPQPPFSAHVWRVAISPDPGRDQWLTVTAEDVTGAALVDVFVADPGVRAPGQPMPLRLLGKSGDSFEVCVPTNQSLFVMVSNPTEALQAAAKVRVDVLKAPFIASLSPASGPVGAPVTITGTGFGVMQGTVTFNGTAATVTSWSDTNITAIVPPGTTTGNVIVKHHHVAAAASNGISFTVLPPTAWRLHVGRIPYFSIGPDTEGPIIVGLDGEIPGFDVGTLNVDVDNSGRVKMSCAYEVQGVSLTGSGTVLPNPAPKPGQGSYVWDLTFKWSGSAGEHCQGTVKGGVDGELLLNGIGTTGVDGAADVPFNNITVQAEPVGGK